MRYVLPAMFTAIPSAEMFSIVSVKLSPFIAGLIGLVWLMAVLKNFVENRRLERQTDIGSIRSLTWREFELLTEAFRRQGYRAVDTGGDGGADAVAHVPGCAAVNTMIMPARLIYPCCTPRVRPFCS